MNEKHHYRMGSTDLLSIHDRQNRARRNYMTNFINPETGSFERQGQFATFCAKPAKPIVESQQVSKFVDEMKQCHIEVGHAHKDNFGFEANRTYGSFKQTTGGNKALPWATMQTNFALGAIPNKTVTDYKDRFQLGNRSFSTAKDEGLVNKAKLQSSSVQLQGNNTPFHTRGVSHD